MKKPTLADLPPPPPGKVGWPWTEGAEPVSAVRSDGSPWPTISIVTPSYNQGQYLEETIRSILLQCYPSLEYIVIDGGSTDQSVETIRKYEPWLTYWISEKDNGQAEAINKGLKRSSGEIFQFINSDDYLAPGALCAVANAMGNCHAVAGVVINFDPDGSVEPIASRKLTPVNFVTRAPGYLYHQPGVWLKTKLIEALGGYDIRWRYKFDWILQIQYAERWPKVAYIDNVLAYFRLHDSSKTVSERSAFWEEELVARDLMFHSAIDPDLLSALRQFVRQRHWRKRVDELVVGTGHPPRHSAIRLIAESLRAPFRRIDRYSLGALRRILSK